MLFILLFLLILVLCIILFLQHPQFGKLSSGDRLERIKQSSHYKNGEFKNIHFTPTLVEGVSALKATRQFFFEKSKQNKPNGVLPSIKTNLLTTGSDENYLVWFGHSSYFIQVDGKRILVDPVFSGAASPIPVTTKSFKGSDIYTTDDFPEIDFLFITHDHWDHLDYPTVKKLIPKVKCIITGLGTGAHLEYWGYEKNKIIEKDWNESIQLSDQFVLHATAARHFSGRFFKRNMVSWMSFALHTPSKKLFIGGDSGYDTHYAEIGNAYGPFDLAILECGQYNENWKYIHNLPEEAVQAAIDLKAGKILPVHWGKFSLSLHSWDEPIKRLVAEAEKKNLDVVHPMIGEKVDLDSTMQFQKWWELPLN